MPRPEYIPEGYDRIVIVDNEEDIFKDEFHGRVNCFFHQRRLSGDFNALAHALYPIAKTWQDQRFGQRQAIYQRLSEIAEGSGDLARAARHAKRDYDMLEARGFDAELRTIDHEYYEPAETSLHMDMGSMNEELLDRMGTVLCAYTKPATGWARNEDCNDGLRVYGPHNMTLIFDLKSGARKFSFAPGDLVRVAAENNLHHVKGFVHNAEFIAKDSLRLLLVGRVAPG